MSYLTEALEQLNNLGHLKEAYAMHKDYAIELVDEYDDGRDVLDMGYKFKVPAIHGVNKYFYSIEDAKEAIDAIVSNNKGRKVPLRPEYALLNQVKLNGLKNDKESLEELINLLLLWFEHHKDSFTKIPTKEELLHDDGNTILDLMYMNLKKDALPPFVGEEFSDILNLIRSLEIRDRYVTSVADIDKEINNRSNIHREGGIEHGDYPWYVTCYVGGAVYEPAEGGYYVDTNSADFARGFDTKPEAQRYAKKIASELGYTKIDDNWYAGERGKYVGEHADVKVESRDEYLSDEQHYYGYC